MLWIAVSKAGDCDGSGSVSIAEVQSAINIFLGLKAAALCVDRDSNGKVSNSEVQNVINFFFGIVGCVFRGKPPTILEYTIVVSGLFGKCWTVP